MPGFFRHLAGLFVVSLLLAIPVTSRAGIVFQVQSVEAHYSTTGQSLDVLFTNNSGSVLTIGGFSFGLETSNPDIQFTSVTTSTTSPYIFAGMSGAGPNLETTVGSSVIASDFYSTANAGVTVANGQTVGLGHVLFNIGNIASGTVIPVTFIAFPTTSLSDASGNDITITTLGSGAITAVPEPSSVALASVIGTFGMGLVLYRRRVKPVQTQPIK